LNGTEISMPHHPDLIVSISGVRGIVGAALTPEAVMAFASGLGSFTGGGKLVVGRDSRSSGLMLQHAVMAGLLSTGCDVVDLGIVPTPTCGLALRRLRAAGGIQITASHNAAPWNGLKFLSADGKALSAKEGRGLVETFEGRDVRYAPWDRLRSSTAEPQSEQWHCDRVLELVQPHRIRALKPRVLVDGNGGAGGPLSRLLLESLGCEGIYHACDTDGLFRHEPEPTEENVRSIGPLITENAADIGFLLDPDSDRLALLDEDGRYIGEELTLALALLRRLKEQSGPIVINMSSSRVCEDIAAKFGCPCYRSAVGEANVVEKMQEVGAVIGGEGNGGVIDPRVGWIRDPFIGMGLILSLLADSGKKLSELVTELPKYAMVKQKCVLDRSQLGQAFEQFRRQWPEATANLEDGLRLDWSDHWVHVRPSNTEPIVRVIAEAHNYKQAKRLCEEAIRSLQT
jgi:phosphomannomutase